MKKYLSTLLAILTVLSCSVFAAPVTVDTVETAREAVIDVSVLPEADDVELEDENDNGVLLFNIDCEREDATITSIGTSWQSAQKITNFTNNPNLSGFSAQMYFTNYNGNDVLTVADDGTGNKALKMDAHYKWSRLNVVAGGKDEFFPAGTYTLTYDIRASSDTDWDSSHVLKILSGIAYSSSPKNGITLTSGFATIAKASDKTSNTIKFNAEANSVNRFQIMQDITWNTAHTDLVKDSNGAVANTQPNLTFTYYLDNVKLYYKAPAKVTFASSVEATVPAPVEGVLCQTTFNASQYAAVAKDATKAFKGWSLTEGGEIVDTVDVTGDITLYANYDEAVLETHPQYGQLAYWVDFNKATLSGATYNYFDTTTVLVAAPQGLPAASALKVKAWNSDNGYNVKDGEFSFDGGYPRIAITTDAQNPFPEGCYTVVYSAKADISGGVNNVLMVNGINETKWPTSAAPVAGSLAKLTDSFKEYSSSVVYSVDDNGVGTVTGTSGTFEDMNLGKLGMYFSYTTDRTVKRYVDYIKIYYSPLVDISFDANGKDVKVPETLEDATLFNPATQPVCEDVGTARFAGWSETPDGEIITSPKTFNKNTTLYAVWDENYYAGEDENAAGDLVISFNYNKMVIANHHSNIWIYGTTEGERFAELIYGGTKPSSGPWFPQGNKNADDSWVYGFNYGEYGKTGSYNHPDNAFLIDQKITDGATKFPKVYLPAGSTLKDGIYTMFLEVSVKKAENATVSADSFVSVKLSGESVYKEIATNTTELTPDGEKYYLKKTIFVNDGYYGEYETGIVHKIDGSAKSSIGFNFSVAPVDTSKEAHAKIECDNFKLYYKEYTYAPRSYNENSIRVTDPAGIRFKASVSNLERSDATVTEYGFIVARKSTLDAADVTPENFTAESGVKFSKGVAYGTVDGESVDKIFEATGGQTFFTAVVYNIPADKYTEDIVVKPYIVKDGETIYGTAMVNNIKAVAEALKKTDNYELYKDAVDKIIAGEEL